MPRYLLSEKDSPLNTDYYYESNCYSSKTCFPHIHTHNYYEIYLYLKDGATFILDDKVSIINFGSIVIVPPYKPHYMINTGNGYIYKRAYLWISEYCLSTFTFREFSLIKPIKEAIEKKQYIFQLDTKESIELVESSFIQIANSKKLDNIYGKELMNRSHILQSLVTISRCIIKKMDLKTNKKEQSLISDLIGYINTHYASDLTLDLLANEFHLNKFTLSKTFKSHTNVTLHNYLNMKRIENAKQFMLSGLLPTKVYSLCGFHNYTTFYRCFTKAEGITPQQFMELSETPYY